MLKYTVQRLLAMALTLFIIVTIGFMAIRLMPGSIYSEEQNMSAAQRQALEAKYYLDKPIYYQYYMFLNNLVMKGDWGTSLQLYVGAPVWDVLKTKIPISMYNNVFALLFSLPLGVLFGILAAVKKNSYVDYATSFLVVLFISVPSFIFATLMQYYCAFKWGWFDIIYNPNYTGLAKLYNLALPILALSFAPIARVTRYLRAELAETIGSDFMLLARAKGLTQWQATVRHGVRNSLIPLANVIITMFTHIMGGSLVIETIFSIPGMGGLMVSSINASDYPLTLAVLIFYSFISLVTVLIVDLAYGIIDPRIRIGGKRVE